MACLTPATCHSLTSRYSLSASAARNDRLRPVLLASFSSRLLTSVSTRTVNVVEDIANYLVVACVQISTRYGSLQILGRVLLSPMAFNEPEVVQAMPNAEQGVASENRLP